MAEPSPRKMLPNVRCQDSDTLIAFKQLSTCELGIFRSLSISFLGGGGAGR